MTEFLEFHDARLAAVRIDSTGTIYFDFEHICGHSDSASGSETWSCGATLAARQPTKFSIEGTLGSRDYVSEGEVVDASAREVEIAAFSGLRCGSGSLALLLAGSGARINATFASLTLERLERIRLVDERRPTPRFA